MSIGDQSPQPPDDDEQPGEEQEKSDEEPELREIAPEELQEILAQHKKWIETEGEEGERADLYNTNLQGANLRKANLRMASLQGANLIGANLIGAELHMAILEGAKLQGAALQGANLEGANLEGANLEEANLEGASLEGANLKEANLKGADLSFADLKGADLIGADLMSAELAGTDFYACLLQNSIMVGAKTLQVDQLTGADLSNATLPHNLGEFAGVEIVKEATVPNRKLFVSLLVACVYSVITIFNPAAVGPDADITLPLLQTKVPLGAFYFGAPLLLFSVFFYLHLNLQAMWKQLARLPAVFKDGRTLDQTVSPWMLNRLVAFHVLLLRQGPRPFSFFDKLLPVVLAWWSVPVTLFLFLIRDPGADSFDVRSPWLTLDALFPWLTFATSVVCAFAFQQLMKRTLRREELPFWLRPFRRKVVPPWWSAENT